MSEVQIHRVLREDGDHREQRDRQAAGDVDLSRLRRPGQHERGRDHSQPEDDDGHRSCRVHTEEADRDSRNRCQQAENHGAEGSDHMVKNLTISILSQLRKYETVATHGLPRSPRPPQRSQ